MPQEEQHMGWKYIGQMEKGQKMVNSIKMFDRCGHDSLYLYGESCPTTD